MVCLIFYRFGLVFLFGFLWFEIGTFERKIVNLFSFDFLFLEFFFFHENDVVWVVNCIVFGSWESEELIELVTSNRYLDHTLCRPVPTIPQVRCG